MGILGKGLDFVSGASPEGRALFDDISGNSAMVKREVNEVFGGEDIGRFMDFLDPR